MLSDFKQKMFNNYPEEYKEEFINKIEYTNYLRTKYFSKVLVLLSFTISLLAILSNEMDILITANLTLFVSSTILSLVFTSSSPNKENLGVLNRLTSYIEILIIIIWSSTVIVFIPERFELVSTYSIVIVSISALLFLKWQAALSFFGLSVVYIVFFNINGMLSQGIPTVTTLVMLIAVAWIISRMLYIKEIENFVNEKLIESKILEEEKSKKKLKENYLQLVEANKRIKNKTEQLAKANEQLSISEKEAKLANSIKTDFLARMSHDMRTPLTAVIGLSEFGIEEHKGDKDFEYFRSIKESSEYLLSLVNDTLDIQKLESRNINLNYTIEECGSAAKKVLNIVESEAKVKGINLVTDTESSRCNEFIRTDEKRLEQILINILNNAIKYTPRGGIVTWNNEVVHIDEENMIVRNTITDSGVGMSTEFIKHMYEPFSKEHNIMSDSESSTGLGLSICKNLVETMGGDISCDTELGKGTKFTIDIPHEYANKEEIDIYLKNKEKIEHIQYSDSKKALICEDSVINAEILSKILIKIGICSEHAKNGQEGINMAKMNKYDVIFMDIRMPIMNGITAAKEIRKFDNETPIIALSANAYKEDVEKSIKVGMNAHLAKPFNRENIYKEIGKYL